MPTGCAASMKDDRPRSFLLQFCVDVPDHRLALLLIHLARLLVKKLLQTAVAVSGEIAVGIAGVALVELLIGIVDNSTAGIFEPDHIVPARDLRVPIGGLDQVEIPSNVNFFLITRYPQLLRHGTKQEHTGCFCGFERWRATRCNFKRGSARPSLRFFTEQRISAGRR